VLPLEPQLLGLGLGLVGLQPPPHRRHGVALEQREGRLLALAAEVQQQHHLLLVVAVARDGQRVRGLRCAEVGGA